MLNEQDDYTKTRNYWKYLKGKLKKENPQLVSATNQLKLKAADGKSYLTDMLDAEGVMLLARSMPNTNAMDFLDWFTYSDNTIDGQSRKKAYNFIEMNVAHQFMEGNGRSTRIWLDLILKRSLRRCVDWSQIDKNEYLQAMRESVVESSHIKNLIRQALTTKIDDRKTFMKGIDYSYYYKQNDYIGNITKNIHM